MTEKAKSFQDYFASSEHEKLLEKAANRTGMRLANMAKAHAADTSFLNAFSEAMGITAGISAFYERLGLNKRGADLFRAMADDLEKRAPKEGDDA